MLVRVEHDSNGGTHGLGGDVLSELNSEGTSMTVSVDNLSPGASKSSVINSVFDLVNIGDSFAQVPFGTSFVVTVLDGDQGLVAMSGLSISLVTGESTLDVQSDWLSLLVNLLLLVSFCYFFSHYSSL